MDAPTGISIHRPLLNTPPKLYKELQPPQNQTQAAMNSQHPDGSVFSNIVRAPEDPILGVLFLFLDRDPSWFLFHNLF